LAALSVFFNLNSTTSNNNFFEFLTQGDQKYIDLSRVVDLGATIKGSITGYQGSDTIPKCTKDVCWYVYDFPMQISQEQLDAFKVDGVESNYRNGNKALLKKYNPIMVSTSF